MAITRRGNIIYATSTGIAVEQKGLRVTSIVMVATGANAAVVLADPDDTSLFELQEPDDGRTVIYNPRQPLFFPNGVKIKTLTNANVSIVYTDSRPVQDGG